jgi:hypothetical protein
MTPSPTSSSVAKPKAYGASGRGDAFREIAATHGISATRIAHLCRLGAVDWAGTLGIQLEDDATKETTIEQPGYIYLVNIATDSSTYTI